MEKTTKEDTLSDKDFKKLAKIGKHISMGLSCDINGEGVPCRTDRLNVVEAMIEYIELHNWVVSK